MVKKRKKRIKDTHKKNGLAKIANLTSKSFGPELKSKSEDFDVVSITRHIYWPEKGYYEKDTKKNNFFETCYNPTVG